MDNPRVTYRVVVIGEKAHGETALTPELAKLFSGGIARQGRDLLIGMTRTDWCVDNGDGRMVPYRTVLIDAEQNAGDWVLGVP